METKPFTFKTLIISCCLLSIIFQASAQQTDPRSADEKLTGFNQKALTEELKAKLTKPITSKWNTKLETEFNNESESKLSDKLSKQWSNKLSDKLSSKIADKITENLTVKWNTILSKRLPDYSQYYKL